MAHYISKRELDMLERDIVENCGETGYRNPRSRRLGNESMEIEMSERERRMIDRDSRRQTERRSKDKTNRRKSERCADSSAHGARREDTYGREDVDITRQEFGLLEVERRLCERQEEVEHDRDRIERDNTAQELRRLKEEIEMMRFEKAQQRLNKEKESQKGDTGKDRQKESTKYRRSGYNDVHSGRQESDTERKRLELEGRYLPDAELKEQEIENKDFNEEIENDGECGIGKYSEPSKERKDDRHTQIILNEKKGSVHDVSEGTDRKKYENSFKGQEYRLHNTYQEPEKQIHRYERDQQTDSHTYHKSGKQDVDNEIDLQKTDLRQRRSATDNEIKNIQAMIDRLSNESRNEQNEEGRLMNWIDKKFEDVHDKGYIRKYDRERVSEMSDDYSEIDTESEDEVSVMQRGVELLRLQERRVKQEVQEMEIKRKEKEEQRRLIILKEKKMRKEKERQERIKHLKNEQVRLLQSVRENENRLLDLNDQQRRNDTDEARYFTENSEEGRSYYQQRRSGELHPSCRKLARESIGQNGEHGGCEMDKKPFAYTKMLEPKLPKLSEDTFEEWKTEVEVMTNSDLYPKDSLLHCVRNSVSNSSGNIRKVLPLIPLSATTHEILEKLDNVYGDRRTADSHLAEFYRAKQTAYETVAEWGIRLETILRKAWTKGQITVGQMDEMLRKRFWKYLYDEKLKLNTRMLYENVNSFEELRKQVRIEENELNSDSDSSERRTSACAVGKIQDTSKVRHLLDRVKKLEDGLSKKKRQGTDQTDWKVSDEQYLQVERRLDLLEDEIERNRECQTKRERFGRDSRYNANSRYDAIEDETDRSYNRNSRSRYKWQDTNRQNRNWRMNRRNGYYDGDGTFNRSDDKRYYRNRQRNRMEDDVERTVRYTPSDGNWRNSRKYPMQDINEHYSGTWRRNEDNTNKLHDVHTRQRDYRNDNSYQRNRQDSAYERSDKNRTDKQDSHGDSYRYTKGTKKDQHQQNPLNK